VRRRTWSGSWLSPREPGGVFLLSSSALYGVIRVEPVLEALSGGAVQDAGARMVRWLLSLAFVFSYGVDLQLLLRVGSEARSRATSPPAHRV
jgi:hypothetical protein